MTRAVARKRGMVLAVQLNAMVPYPEKELAERLVAAADPVCPSSDAMRGNVEVTVVDLAPEVI